MNDPQACAAWLSLLATFAPVFSQPSFLLWQTLMCGWPLCPGRRTITRILRVGDHGLTHAHDAYHRFVRAGAWAMSSLWRMLATILVSHFHAAGVIPLDLDDTLFHKTGRKVEGAGIFRDAVRSTGTRVVHALGLNLVILTVRVTPPWGGVPLGLPINMRLHRKNGSTYIELAEDMVREVSDWFPDRSFRVCADGAYASLAARNLPRTHVTSRMRSDAAIYALPPPRRKGQRGRPRKKGARLPSPAQLAVRTRNGWCRKQMALRGRSVSRLVLCRTVLWYNLSKAKPLLLVIVRDPDGKEHDDFLFTTDLAAAPEQVATQYAGRWSIEDTFRDVKQYLGGEDPQTWKGKGPERAAALSLWLYSAVWLWYITSHGTSRSWCPVPWYKSKQTPSFLDALAALRRTLWRHRLFPTSESGPLPPKMVDTLIDELARAA
jgi:hypothetical protein